MIPLSVLDQSTALTGRPPAASIAETLELARHCEAEGYFRYWLAEHHNTSSITGSAPEVLGAAIAATTTRIRVGSAGIMLPHYSALKVAEQFRVLDAIAPGRIDLGVGRAPGADMRTAYALNPNAGNAAEAFPAQVRDLMDWLAGRKLIEGNPFRDIIAVPQGATLPEVWMLGSSDYGAQLAGYLGLPYCFAHFITQGAGAAQAMDAYRRVFRPGVLAAPHAAVTVWALAAETQAEAERLFSSRAIWWLGRERGVFAPLPSPEEAAEYVLNDAERATIERMRARAIYGTPDVVVAKLRALAAELGVQELALLTTVHGEEARRRSYSLIMREWGA